MTWRTMLVALNLLLVLAWLGLGIWNNETIIRQGERVLLEMRPVDPRSLMRATTWPWTIRFWRERRAFLRAVS